MEANRHRSEENNDRSERKISICKYSQSEDLRSHLSSPTPVLSPTVVSSVSRRPDTQTEHRERSALHWTELILSGKLTEQHPLVPLRHKGGPVLDLVDGNAG